MGVLEKVRALRQKYPEYACMRYTFEASDKNEYSGNNWNIASLGMGEDNKHYFVTTDYIRASELVGTAKSDAEVITELLNIFCNEKEGICECGNELKTDEEKRTDVCKECS